MEEKGFDITPEELERMVNDVNTLKEQWAAEVKNIQAIVEEFAAPNSVFEGFAANEFVKKMAEYHNTFVTTEKTLNKFMESARNYAQDMKKADEDLQAEASRLSSGLGRH